MATEIAKSRYFGTVTDLSLTPEQELELERYMPIARRICTKFSRELFRKRNDMSMTHRDDLLQMALVRLTRAIKASESREIHNKEHYYTRVITRACTDTIRYTRYHEDKNKHIDLNSEEIVTTTCSDPIDDRLFIRELLSTVKDHLTLDILKHSFGIGTAPIPPSLISDLIPLTLTQIYSRKYLGLKKLRGIAIKWTTSN